MGNFIDFAAKWGRCSKRRNRLIAIYYGMLWVLWKPRNDWLFQGIANNPTKVVENIKSLVFLRLKCKGKVEIYNSEE